MTEDVGQAQLKPLEDTNGFFPGQLGHQFSKGGVSEIEELLNAEILSMEDFLRAEENLEKTPATLDEIEMADIMATTRTEDHHEGTTFNYSLMETGREAQGGKGDENTETGIGRRKVGIQDPDTFKKAQERKRTQYLALDLAQQQSRELERLYARLTAIEQRIDEIDKENAQLEQENIEIEELIDDADELNSSDPSVRRAARAKAENIVRLHGRNLDDFKKEDGTIDTERLNQFLLDQQNQNNDTIDANNDEKDDLIQQTDDIIQKLEQGALASNSPNQLALTNSGTNGNTPESEIASLDADFDTNGSNTFNSASTEVASLEETFGSFDSGDAFGSTETELASNDAFGNDTSNQDFAFSESEQVALQAFDTDNTLGSFSGTGEETASVISAHFASKVSPEDATAEPTPSNDLDQDRQMAFTGGSTTAFTA